MSLILVAKIAGVKEYLCTRCGTRQVRDKVNLLPYCLKCKAVKEDHYEEYGTGDL